MPSQLSKAMQTNKLGMLSQGTFANHSHHLIDHVIVILRTNMCTLIVIETNAQVVPSLNTSIRSMKCGTISNLSNVQITVIIFGNDL